MRIRAKAQSAGSSMRQAGGLGRSFRGALAPSGASLRLGGSGAASHGRLRPAAVALVTGLLCALALLFGASGASASQLFTIGNVGNPGDGSLGLAVNDSTGNVYAIAGLNAVRVYDSSANFLFEFHPANSVSGLAIDQSTGDIYVGEQGGPFSLGRISKYTESGEFILTFGKRVNATTLGDVCTAASGDTCQAGEEGSEDGEISGSPAVDPVTHNIIVPSYENSHIQIFNENGKFLESFPTPGRPTQGAVDASGNIYAGEFYGRVFHLTTGKESLGLFSPVFESEFIALSLAVAPGTSEPSKEHLYASLSGSRGGLVGEFDSNGTLLFEHGLGLPGVGYIAVDPNNERIYVANNASPTPIFILGHPTTLPDPVVGPVTNVTGASATLTGTVNPEGGTLDTSYRFEYRKDSESTWTQTAGADVGHGTSPVAVSQDIAGLDPNTVYHVRLTATREFGGGSRTSAEATFKTGYEPPRLSLIAPTHVTDTTAILQAQIDPRHAATAYYFEYGTSQSYGASVPADQEGDAGSQLGFRGVFEQVSGLQPDTEYHFRLVAQNPGGTTPGQDETFKTLTTAEVQWPARDIELVSNPEKGNQGASPISLFGQTVTSDGTEVLWRTPAGAPGGTSGNSPLFLARRTASGWSNTPIAVPAAQQVGGGDFYYEPFTASSDFSTYVFQAADSGYFAEDHPKVILRVTANGEQQEIENEGPSYTVDRGTVWITNDNQHVVYIDPKTNPRSIVDFSGGENHVVPTPSCGYNLGGSVGEEPVYPFFAIADASRFFVESAGNEAGCEAPGVYMIEPAANKITLVAPGGHFIRTNPQGSAIVYVKEGNAYKWSEAGGGECLTCGIIPAGATFNPFGVQVSQDLSRIYFCGAGNSHDQICEIYEYHDGAVRFVSPLRAFDGPMLGDHSTKLTPDGKTLVFVSGPGPTADNIESGRGADPFQVYRFSDETDRTECVSCPGTRELVKGGVTFPRGGAGDTMSEDGSTIIFSTSAALVPRDINGRPDMYEWHAGTVRLITDGETEFKSGLYSVPQPFGISADGRTAVYLVGGVQLTGNEADNYSQVYAGVVGGKGFPPPNPPAHCSEDSCQGPLQPPPALDTQGSSSFHGAESPAPRRRARHKHHRKKRHHARPATAGRR